MQTAPTLRRFIADTATWAAIGPAMLLFMGWSKVRAYHGSFGLHDLAAMPSTPALMIAGLRLMREPLLATAFIYLLAWLFESHRQRRWVAPLKVAKVPLLAYAVAGTVVAGAISLLDWPDSSPDVFGSISVLDLFSLAGASAMCVPLAWAAGSLTAGNLAKMFLGNTLSGTVVLGFLLLGAGWLHADNVGWELGEDHASACVHYPGIHFWSSALNMTGNQTFLFIAHEGGMFYVRDMAVEANYYGAIAVRQDLVEFAHFTVMPPVRECDD